MALVSHDEWLTARMGNSMNLLSGERERNVEIAEAQEEVRSVVVLCKHQ